MGPIVGLEAAKREKETPAPRRKAPSLKEKSKMTSPTVQAIRKNWKDKVKYISFEKLKAHIEVLLFEGVPKKRRLVLESVMPANKAKVKFSFEKCHLDLDYVFDASNYNLAMFYRRVSRQPTLKIV